MLSNKIRFLCWTGCYNLYGHHLTKFHDQVMREWLSPPFGRWRSWKLRRWSTESVSHRANLQTQVCPTQVEKQNCILALPWETKLRLSPCITLNTHTEYPVCVNHQIQNAEEKPKCPHCRKPYSRQSYLCIIYMQLGSAWLGAPVRAEPGSQKNTIQVGIQILWLPHPTPPFLSWKQRDRICSALWEISWG